MFHDNMLMLMLSMVYILCIFIEIKALKRNHIDIFYKENFLLILTNSAGFPLAIFALIFGYSTVTEILCSNHDIMFVGYFFTFLFASFAYIIHYVKSKIYAFIAGKNKLSFLKSKTLYDRNDF